MALTLRTNPEQEQVSPIFEQSLAAFGIWMKSFWSKVVAEPELTIRYSDQYENDRDILSQAQTDKRDKFPLPIVDYVVVAIEPGWAHGNRQALWNGVYTGKTDSNTNGRTEKLVPVDVGIGVQFEASDQRQAILFAQLWHQQSPDRSFVVKQIDTNAQFFMKIKPDASVQIPQRSAATDEQGKTIRVETTAIIETYSGLTTFHPLITKIDVRLQESYTRLVLEEINTDNLRLSRYYEGV